MDLEDFFTPEVGVTAAIVAALASPKVRQVLRRGAVVGLAGLLIAGDAAKQVAENVGHNIQDAAAQAQRSAAANQANGSANAGGTAARQGANVGSEESLS